MLYPDKNCSLHEDLHQCSHCSNETTELFYFEGEGEEVLGYCLECSMERNNELNEEYFFSWS